MKGKSNRFLFILLLLVSCTVKAPVDVTTDENNYREPHRPQLHFSPKEKWMNDPNGMVWHNGQYHLFYQYHPDGLVWGPMHWGHAVSTDLFNWTHLPIALYPDSLGLIFSGSAVLDKDNTSGFGSKENPPLVAIFTHHSQSQERKGKTDYQNQSIAYSTDGGKTWTKYQDNPVLKNQGIKDFRDPKVFWHDATKKWIMILAVLDHVELWASPDLKSWDKLSDFGLEHGAHGGVWECPDLFELNISGASGSKWVMIVSLNPGGPNGGSGTQYFIGDFDGKNFVSDTSPDTTAWLDYGPDNYAGVTWSNAPDNRKIFLGWMSNWDYAQDVPTSPWRSAMTIPRELQLTQTGTGFVVRSAVVREIEGIVSEKKTIRELKVEGAVNVMENAFDFSQSMVSFSFAPDDLSVELYNATGQKVIVGFDQSKNRYFVDRSQSGKINFAKNFSGQSFAPRISSATKINCTIIADVSSLEVFFDDGVSVMTSVFFPDTPLSMMQIKSPRLKNVENLTVRKLASVWK
jgi:fructan beta-fructosidase